MNLDQEQINPFVVYLMKSLGYTYAKQCISWYLKFQVNWACCILFSVSGSLRFDTGIIWKIKKQNHPGHWMAVGAWSITCFGWQWQVFINSKYLCASATTVILTQIWTVTYGLSCFQVNWAWIRSCSHSNSFPDRHKSRFLCHLVPAHPYQSIPSNAGLCLPDVCILLGAIMTVFGLK